VSSGFNPRAREGRDRYAPCTRRKEHVSIHAPVKGATPLHKSRLTPLGFNPRAREGRDLTVLSVPDVSLFQSTRP